MPTDTVLDKKDTPPISENVTSQEKVASPEGKEPSPQAAPRTYTEEEHQKEIHSALMKAGRDWKGLEVERDSLRKQIESLNSNITEAEAEREALNKQIKDLTSDDPEKFNLIKKEIELRERERKLKAEVATLEADKKSHGDKIKLAEDTLREISIWEITGEYEGSNPEKLKEVCDKLNATTDDQIRTIANSLWVKTAVESPPKETPLKVDSSVTIGALTEQTIREAYRNNPNDPKAKADYLAWRRQKGI